MWGGEGRSGPKSGSGRDRSGCCGRVLAAAAKQIRSSESLLEPRSDSRLAARVEEVGGWPELDHDERALDVWGVDRALLNELHKSRVVVRERGATCNTWGRTPHEAT